MRYQKILKIFLWLLTIFLADGKEDEFLNWKSSKMIMDENLLSNDSVGYSTIEVSTKPIKNLLNLSSVWDCDNYSAAIEVVTKKAIALAEEVRIYLQSSKERSDDKKLSQQVSIRNIKINLLNRCVDFQKDFYPILKIIWIDTMKALTIIGKTISDELEFRISKLPISIK